MRLECQRDGIRSVGGGFADETFTGTYAVNPDCTGNTTLNFYESGQLVRTSVLSLVFDNSEREIRMFKIAAIAQRCVPPCGDYR